MTHRKGLARFSDKSHSSLSKLRGTYAYAAPETYKGQPYTTKSDVFSFGIVLWEMVMRCLSGTYHKPYSEHKNLKYDFQVLIQTAKNGLRPTIHPSNPSPFTKLMQQCWEADPEKRPSFEAVLESLKQIKKLFDDEQQRKKQSGSAH